MSVGAAGDAAPDAPGPLGRGDRDHRGLHPGGGRGGHPGPGGQVPGQRLVPDLGGGPGDRAGSGQAEEGRGAGHSHRGRAPGSRSSSTPARSLAPDAAPAAAPPRTATAAPAPAPIPDAAATRSQLVVNVHQAPLQPSVAWAWTMSTITESIGRVLAGRYRIESALGSGASANVFAAFDTTLQRRVAVKVLHPALAADGGFLRRFRAEAQSAAALANAHVLAVHDWGEDTQGPFLVLEFLGGGSLRDMLDEGTRLSLSQAVAVGAQAAEGLAYAHARGFVHRDVKPANLLFDEEGRLRVADFGLARALAEASLTEPAGTTVGTARYAAPEQALGQPGGRPGRRLLPRPRPLRGGHRGRPLHRRHHGLDPHGPRRRRAPRPRRPGAVGRGAERGSHARGRGPARRGRLRRPPPRAGRRPARSGQSPAGRCRGGGCGASETGDPAARPRPHRPRHGGAPAHDDGPPGAGRRGSRRPGLCRGGGPHRRGRHRFAAPAPTALAVDRRHRGGRRGPGGRRNDPRPQEGEGHLGHARATSFAPSSGSPSPRPTRSCTTTGSW